MDTVNEKMDDHLVACQQTFKTIQVDETKRAEVVFPMLIGEQ
jgi:hypothetical protein